MKRNQFFFSIILILITWIIYEIKLIISYWGLNELKFIRWLSKEIEIVKIILMIIRNIEILEQFL